MSPSSSNPPPQLARFAPAVQEAYLHYQSTGDEASVQIVVAAALRDLMPAKNRASFPGPLEDDLHLVNDLGYDSLAIAEIVFFFEDLFQVTIGDRDIRGIHTVGELRAFVARKAVEKQGPA